jgi:hypothetical protein
VFVTGLKSRIEEECYAHQLADGVLPLSFAQLTFGERFNQPLSGGVLPQSLTKLTFVEFFDEHCKLASHTLASIYY